MGAAGSTTKGAISDPFPVNQKLSKDLDKLSFVAARILSTPDIYDINNLARPGVCGDYAVFLKKGLEKKLLPFIADISGGLTEVVYQNPRKANTSVDERKKICSQIADTMIRAIATVVACLASIQVKSQSREAAIAAVPKQVGGDVPSVREWLRKAGYISELDSRKNAGLPMDFTVAETATPKFKFTLTLERSEGNLTHGFVKAETKAAAGPDEHMPEGSLRIEFLNSFSIQAPGVIKSVLPVRLVDRAGNCWAAGILYEKYFKTFGPAKETFITLLLERLFRRTQGAAVPLLETTEDLKQANVVFQRLRTEQSEQILYQVLRDWFGEIIPGFQAGYVPQPPPPYVPGYPGQPYAIPAQPYGYQPVRPLGLGLGQGKLDTLGSIVPVALRPTTGDATYDIPLSATKNIMDTLKKFRDLVPKESSPAAARAITLAGSGINTQDRIVQTGVCNDPYWTGQDLSKIYPWATLQFLSVENWSALAGDRNSVKFYPAWTEFLDGLDKIYSSAPLLNRGAPKAKFLDQMRFTKVAEVPICKTPNPQMKFQQVQVGLLKLQGLYERHVAKMWTILNDLIFVIQDPDTKAEIVRLHPNVISASSNKSSAKYVTDKAQEACEALKDYYLAVESAYMESIV